MHANLGTDLAMTPTHSPYVASPLAPRKHSPSPRAHVDPKHPGESVSPSRTPTRSPCRNPKNLFRRTRARLHPDNPSSALLNPPPRHVSRRCLSRAHLTLVLSEHGPSQRTRRAFGRARACAVRSSGFIYFFGAELGLRSASCPSRNARLLTYSSRKRTRLYICTRVGLVQGDARTRPASETSRPRSWYYFIDSLTQHACCVSRV